MKRSFAVALGVCALAGAALTSSVSAQNRSIGINVALKSDITAAILADLGRHGTVLETIPAIDALTMRVAESELARITAKSYVAAANPDAERHGAPVDTIAATDFAGGVSTWNLDAVNVTKGPGAGATNRVVPQDGSGVYVAVLDTGLLDSWRQYFPQERIATQYAKAFRGGGGEVGSVSEPPNVWEHDQHSHGTHVTSVILGYSLAGTPVTGVAPKATIIPVKVLGQNGSGWSSVIARGVTYIADLAANQLAGRRVVINMSLGGPVLDAVEKAAIDYALSKGVVIVASAGNEGTEGMGYPGAYEPVISVAASGWKNEFTTASWWNAQDVADPTVVAHHYITDFSSRPLPGQDLDVAAPGSWVVGPWQLNSGATDFFFIGGTSQASPHVAGIAALLLQKKPSLTYVDITALLNQTTTPLPPSCVANVFDPIIEQPVTICWEAGASGNGLVNAQKALAAIRK